MVPRLLTSPIVWVAVVAAALFGALRISVDEVAFSVFLNCGVVLVMGGVVLALTPEVWRELTVRRFTTLSLLAAGTFVLCLTAFLNSTWNGLYVATHNGWWARVPDSDARLFGVLLAGLMLLTAPGANHGRIGARRLAYAGLALGGSVAAGILLWWLA